MRVFLDPIPAMGVAMRRTALALKMTAPDGVEIVSEPADADLQLLHAIDLNVLRHLKAPAYAVMMHCLDYVADPSGNGDNIPIRDKVCLGCGGDPSDCGCPAGTASFEPWANVWKGAQLVWSYYPLHERKFEWGGLSALGPTGDLSHSPELKTPVFYGAPLGADADVFKKSAAAREHGILTTGYVSGPKREAIEECAIAAHRAGLTTRHLGPHNVDGMTTKVPGWQAVSGISDDQLVELYQSVKYVSGLRHGEGFELPVIEGLLCGARPICFDLPCYRLWFDKHAYFVPPSSGDELIGHLTEIMKRPPRPVLPEERRTIARKFDWRAIGTGFWSMLLQVYHPKANLPLAGEVDDEMPESVGAAIAPGRPSSMIPMVSREVLAEERRKQAFPATLNPDATKKPRLLWVGDSPTTAWTGFGKASKYILRELSRVFDVIAIGTTHDGHPYNRTDIPYDVYPVNYGISKVVSERKPHLAIVQHDPWQVPAFVRAIGNIPTIGVMPIDGKNCNCKYVNGLAMAVWWTNWAAQEARENGYGGQSVVIPLGVDLDIYKPMDKVAARRATGLPSELDDAFIVGYVARNQPRKRLDLAVRHFGEWVKSRNVPDAYLMLQTAPTGESAYDVSELIRFERITNRFIPVETDLRGAIPEAKMAALYNAFDVFWSTSQGEGFGLPALEAMACGTPCVLPDWAAYGDWALPAARLVRVADTSATINFAKPLSGIRIAVLGATPDREDNVAALDELYRDRGGRQARGQASIALAHHPEFRWEQIGQRYIDTATAVLDGPLVMAR